MVVHAQREGPGCAWEGGFEKECSERRPALALKDELCAKCSNKWGVMAHRVGMFVWLQREFEPVVEAVSNA
jgi:hypothetical protein